jgi:predicted DNA-binding protein
MEILMTSPMTKFTKRMKHKLHEVEQRLDALKTATEKQAEHAEKAIRKHVDGLEDEAHKAKDALNQANADMAVWVEDTKETVAGWKSKLDTKMLQSRADRSERYAEAAMVVALSGVDHAEKAMLSATVARHEADHPKT